MINMSQNVFSNSHSLPQNFNFGTKYNFSSTLGGIQQKSNAVPQQSNSAKSEIHLMIKIKSNEHEDRFEPMTISIISSVIGKQSVSIQITNPSNPLFLFYVDLSEVEFHKLKSEQCLLFDFQNFVSFLKNMLDLCINDENFVCILHKKNINESVLVIQERTKFKENNHLILNVTQANDNKLKNYLGALSSEFKAKFEETLEKLQQSNKMCESLNQENLQMKEEMQKMRIEKQNEINSLLNSKNNEINQLKENSFADTKRQLDSLEQSKNLKINELERKIENFQKLYENLSKDKQALEDYKTKLEMNFKDIESKHNISMTELNVYKEDILHLRQENSALNKKCFQQEKELTELKLRNENFSSQTSEKEKGISNLNQLVETLSKQKESYEDSIKSLKAKNAKLESKLQEGIGEINKGNEIIEKLTNDIKRLKSKAKTLKQTLTSQEQLTNQKQLLLDDQIRNVNDLKRTLETKEREIAGLQNQVTSYSIKLTDNEKIIEDNKQMLMYFNKKVNDSMSRPFKSLITTPPMNYSSSFQRPQTNAYNYTSDVKFSNQPQYAQGYSEMTNNQIQGSENLKTSGNRSNNSSGMFIMPETNFCNYKKTDFEKYMVNSNENNSNTVLNQKYSQTSMNQSGEQYEEEFPRQITEPEALNVNK